MFSERQESRRIVSRTPIGDLMRLTVVCGPGTRGSLQVLRRAAELVHSLGAEIQLFVPLVTPYPLPLDRCPVDVAFTVRMIKDECTRTGLRAKIELRLCRDFAECVRCGLPSESTVVLQEPGVWAWREKLFIGTLRRDGHQVVTV